MTKQFICIRCPKGCIINTEYEGNEIKEINGNSCVRGKEYVTEELTCPKRMVTSTVAVKNGIHKVISVATDKAIAKEKVNELMNVLKDIEVEAPVNLNDLIIAEVLGTDVNIIATRSMKKM